MELKVIMKTGRSVVVELTDSGRYYSDEKYDIYVNDEKYMESDKVITTLYGLRPDTEYSIGAIYNGVSIAPVTVRTEYEFVTLNVREFGARGDGEHDDTNAIQCAVMACPKSGRVLVPAGDYRISSIFLKSDITLELEKDAVLRAFTEREKFPILPGVIESYDETDEYNLGSWEGNPLDCFSAIVCGINVENVVITGEGVIDGNAGFDNWWYNVKVRNIAWRPRLFFINHCQNVTMHGITVRNSPSWTLHPYFSRHLQFIDIKILNPADSHNTDGLDPESCTDVRVIGTYISVGDDCIAIKSGKIYMGRKHKVPTSDMIVRQCCMRDGHGAVTVGSEIAAGVRDVHIRDCIFMNTDRGLRVKTRRGRGKDSVLDDISFENITMNNVMTPFVVNSFYFCDPDGKTEYVGTQKALPVDDRTPAIGRLTFKDIKAAACHVAGAYICGLPESKIEQLTFENVEITYAQDAKSGIAAMMLACQESCKKGITVSNIKELILKNVKVEGCVGEAVTAENTDTIIKE